MVTKRKSNNQIRGRRDRHARIRRYDDDNNDDNDDRSTGGTSSDDGEVQQKNQSRQPYRNRNVRSSIATNNSQGSNKSNRRQRRSSLDMDDDIDSLPASQLEIPYEMGYSQGPNNSDSDGDSADGPAIESPDRANRKAEPLRPNDVIKYTCPIYTAGNKLGERHAVVVGTNPDDPKFPLILHNNDFLPWDTLVQRIYEYHKGEMYRHAGIGKPVSRFAMEKSGETNVSNVTKRRAQKIKAILHQIEESAIKVLVTGTNADDPTPGKKEGASSTTSGMGDQKRDSHDDSSTSSDDDSGSDSESDSSNEHEDDDSSVLPVVKPLASRSVLTSPFDAASKLRIPQSLAKRRIGTNGGFQLHKANTTTTKATAIRKPKLPNSTCTAAGNSKKKATPTKGSKTCQNISLSRPRASCSEAAISSSKNQRTASKPSSRSTTAAASTKSMSNLCVDEEENSDEEYEGSVSVNKAKTSYTKGTAAIKARATSKSNPLDVDDSNSSVENLKQTSPPTKSPNKRQASKSDLFSFDDYNSDGRGFSSAVDKPRSSTDKKNSKVKTSNFADPPLTKKSKAADKPLLDSASSSDDDSVAHRQQPRRSQKQKASSKASTGSNRNKNKKKGARNNEILSIATSPSANGTAGAIGKKENIYLNNSKRDAANTGTATATKRHGKRATKKKRMDPNIPAEILLTSSDEESDDGILHSTNGLTNSKKIAKSDKRREKASPSPPAPSLPKQQKKKQNITSNYSVRQPSWSSSSDDDDGSLADWGRSKKHHKSKPQQQARRESHRYKQRSASRSKASSRQKSNPASDSDEAGKSDILPSTRNGDKKTNGGSVERTCKSSSKNNTSASSNASSRKDCKNTDDGLSGKGNEKPELYRKKLGVTSNRLLNEKQRISSDHLTTNDNDKRELQSKRPFKASRLEIPSSPLSSDGSSYAKEMRAKSKPMVAPCGRSPGSSGSEQDTMKVFTTTTKGTNNTYGTPPPKFALPYTSQRTPPPRSPCIFVDDNNNSDDERSNSNTEISASENHFARTRRQREREQKAKLATQKKGLLQPLDVTNHHSIVASAAATRFWEANDNSSGSDPENYRPKKKPTRKQMAKETLEDMLTQSSALSESSSWTGATSNRTRDYGSVKGAAKATLSRPPLQPRSKRRQQQKNASHASGSKNYISVSTSKSSKSSLDKKLRRQIHTQSEEDEDDDSGEEYEFGENKRVKKSHRTTVTTPTTSVFCHEQYDSDCEMIESPAKDGDHNYQKKRRHQQERRHRTQKKKKSTGTNEGARKGCGGSVANEFDFDEKGTPAISGKNLARRMIKSSDKNSAPKKKRARVSARTGEDFD